MKRRFMLLVYGFLMLTLLLPFQAAAAEADSAVVAESSKTGVTMVETGGPTLALKEDGTVWEWGRIEVGWKYDNGTTPVQVQDLSSVVAIATGDQNIW